MNSLLLQTENKKGVVYDRDWRPVEYSDDVNHLFIRMHNNIISSNKDPGASLSFSKRVLVLIQRKALNWVFLLNKWTVTLFWLNLQRNKLQLHFNVYVTEMT